jgi:uncharacterized phiE125 gp8 family phage protein
VTFQTISPPADEPISVEEFALHSNVPDDDIVIAASCLISARGYVETYLHKRLITQTVQFTRDGFGCGGGIDLPIGPVQSIGSVEYLDHASVWQSVSSDLYRLVQSGEPARLQLAYGCAWPATLPVDGNVRITLVVGYGDSRESIDPAILAALRLMAGHLFENRESTLIGVSSGELPFGVKALLSPHVLWL